MSIWDLAPDTVEVVVVHDGVEILREARTLEVSVDEPNGEGCGERRYATAEVDVPAA